MSILKLVQLDRNDFNERNTLLRKESGVVTDFSDKLQKIIDDILETFYSHNIAVGLAAPQVGIPLKIAVINPDKKNKPEKTLIIVNPKIISTSGQKDKKKEACMSLPNYQGEVERRSKIEITYQDRFGVEHKLKEKGFIARILGHEIDHLEGFLYVDRMNAEAQIEIAEFFKND